MSDVESRYRKLRLIREVENAIIREYPSNEIKTPCHLAIGAEAIAVSICDRFPTAKVFASYRNHHWYIACGGSIENFFLELYGRQNPIADGKAGSMHLACPDEGLVMTSAVVGTQIGPAIGHAFAMKYKGEDTPTIAALGDGATEEGTFYECLNLAKLHKLKIIFVVEDNQLAIHQTKASRQSYQLPIIARAYGIQYHAAKANDLPKIQRSLDNCAEEYPVMMHFFYHRFMEHVGTTQDYGAGYRKRPGNLDSLDPVLSYVRARGPLSLGLRNKINEEVEKEVYDAVAKAKVASFAPKESLLANVFAS